MARLIDVVWTRPHYQEHLLPIYEALPEDMRGEVRGRGEEPLPGHVGLVGAWSDLEPLRGHHDYIYVEHGAGQGYGGDEKSALQPGYSASGGYRHHGCLGFICPSQTVADRWTTAPAQAVGCPKLDQYFNYRQEPIPNSVCFGWHWDCRVSQEATSAWRHYESDIADIVGTWKDQGWRVFGHAHPRWEGGLNAKMDQAGMEVLPTGHSVLSSMSMLIMDNSSLIYEMAALDRPVMLLNAPWYRKEIDHGLRFWSELPGPTVEGPNELVQLSLDGTYRELTKAAWAFRRWDVTCRVYKYTDGLSSRRAAAFIGTLLP